MSDDPAEIMLGILKKIAIEDPMHTEYTGCRDYYYCPYCDYSATTVENGFTHNEDCAWVAAKEFVKAWESTQKGE